MKKWRLCFDIFSIKIYALVTFALDFKWLPLKEREEAPVTNMLTLEKIMNYQNKISKERNENFTYKDKDVTKNVKYKTKWQLHRVLRLYASAFTLEQAQEETKAKLVTSSFNSFLIKKVILIIDQLPQQKYKAQFLLFKNFIEKRTRGIFIYV